MKDFDFDELDKAVSSLISTTPANPPGFDDNGDRIVEIGSQTPPVDEAKSVEPVAPASAPTPGAVSPDPSLAGRRSTGQFMDVVHPSSDMRRTTLTTSAVPPRPAPVPTPTTTPPVVPLTGGSSPLSPAVSPVPAQAPSAAATPAVPTEVVAEPEDDIDKELGQLSGDKPLDSPFLADAKVEKRPLGAFSDQPQPTADADQPVAAVSSEDPAPTTAEVAKKDDTAKPKEEELPAELQDELLKIESDDAEEKAEEKPVADTPGSADKTAEVVAPVPASITQQYKEHPSTGDQASGAVYDTDAYHKALVRPAKSKPGWMLVLWIGLLLVVGAGGGAALYFFVISPTL